MQREDEEVGVHPPTTADQPVSSTTVMGAAAVAAASAASPSKRSPNKVRRETEEQEKYRLIMEKKQSTSVESLCAGFPGACVYLHLLFDSFRTALVDFVRLSHCCVYTKQHPDVRSGLQVVSYLPLVVCMFA